jgi:hypothetical protein
MATELAMNPLPVMVVEKTPSGIWPLLPAAVMTGVGAVSAMEALAIPPIPDTVIKSVLEAGMAAGAV